MTGTVPTPLAPLVQKFFTERLISQLGASANTIASYRDTFRLLLEFAEAQCGLASTDMDISGHRCRPCRELSRTSRDRTRQQRAEPQCPSCRHPFLHSLCRGQRTPGPAPLPEDPATAGKAAQKGHRDLAHGRRDQGTRRRARPRHLVRDGVIGRCWCSPRRPAFGCRNWSASGSGMSNSDAVPMCGAMARGARTVRHPCGAIR